GYGDDRWSEGDEMPGRGRPGERGPASRRAERSDSAYDHRRYAGDDRGYDDSDREPLPYRGSRGRSWAGAAVEDHRSSGDDTSRRFSTFERVQQDGFSMLRKEIATLRAMVADHDRARSDDARSV